MEDIIDLNYNHAKIVSKDFETKNFCEYCNFILKVTHYYLIMLLKTLRKRD